MKPHAAAKFKNIFYPKCPNSRRRRVRLRVPITWSFSAASGNRPTSNSTIKQKRAYEAAEAGDGPRYLVDRLWPRGIGKDSLHLDDWRKDVAPSNELRRWFGHDPHKWSEFRKKYFAELAAKPEAWALLAQAAKKRSITLVYDAKDTEHNNAVALAEFLKKRI